MSRTVGISLVKDEHDVIVSTMTHLAAHVDHIIVSDNGSTDGTREILAELARSLPLTVLDDPDLAYYQSAKTSALADLAVAEHGAEWVIPVDADEAPICSHGRIGDALGELPPMVNVASAFLFNHLATALDDPDENDPFKRMVWRQPHAVPLRKVAVRWMLGGVIHQGNHGVSLPVPAVSVSGLVETRHFPVRSVGQFISKVTNGGAAYAATDLPESEGAHWRGWHAIYESGGPEALAEIVRGHWLYEDPEAAGLVCDPVPLAYP